MAAVSVVRKLQRCDRIHGRRDDLPHVVKYKIKIKEGISASNSIAINSDSSSLSAAATKVLAELTDTLLHVSPPDPLLHEASRHTSPFLQRQEDDVPQHGRSPRLFCLPEGSLQGIVGNAYSSKLAFADAGQLHHEAQRAEPGSASKRSPQWKQLMAKVDENSGDEEEGMWEMLPWRPKENDCDEEVDEGKMHEALKSPGGMDAYLDSDAEREDEVAAAWESALKEKTQGKRGEKEELGVKEIECECCGLREECTKAYEERVRAQLCGHWLCGLCEEAVREEQKRLGGRAAGGEMGLQMALQAHMRPCQGFSSRARAKACPPPSDVAVPHAVCRLLRRHLSTPSPSPRAPPPSSGLPRSCSCLPTFHQGPQP